MGDFSSLNKKKGATSTLVIFNNAILFPLLSVKASISSFKGSSYPLSSNRAAGINTLLTFSDKISSQLI